MKEKILVRAISRLSIAMAVVVPGSIPTINFMLPDKNKIRKT